VKHLFVINPPSFPVQAAQDKVVKRIQDYFADTNKENFSILISRYSRDAIALVRKWIEKNRCDDTVRVYAVGGDGILFDCLNGIVGLPNTELAAIPYGTSNDFVRAFGENKKNLFRDIASMASSPSIPTDIIHCGNNYAINFCSLGLESDGIRSSVELYNQASQRIKKYQWLNSFLYSTVPYIISIRTVFNKKILNQHYTINLDGEDFSGVYSSINLANGPCYGGNMNPVITAMPDDGVLDGLFCLCTSGIKALRIIPGFVKGGFLEYPKYFLWKRFKTIEIRSEDPLLVVLDGEMFFDTYLKVEIVPKAINFVAPGGIGYLKRMKTDEKLRYFQ